MQSKYYFKSIFVFFLKVFDNYTYFFAFNLNFEDEARCEFPSLPERDLLLLDTFLDLLQVLLGAGQVRSDQQPGETIQFNTTYSDEKIKINL